MSKIDYMSEMNLNLNLFIKLFNNVSKGVNPTRDLTCVSKMLVN